MRSIVRSARVRLAVRCVMVVWSAALSFMVFGEVVGRSMALQRRSLICSGNLTPLPGEHGACSTLSVARESLYSYQILLIFLVIRILDDGLRIWCLRSHSTSIEDRR